MAGVTQSASPIETDTFNSYALTFFPGKELARFSHELLQYYLQSGPICAHGNRVTLFNSDCSAVMTFQIDYEKEKN